jgi:hypothetical protein
MKHATGLRYFCLVVGFFMQMSVVLAQSPVTIPGIQVRKIKDPYAGE